MTKANIKHRSLALMIILIIITFGIYLIYWIVSTKRELVSLGADIPTSFLLIIPIANIYYIYRYAEGFSNYVKKDKNSILWFLLMAIIGPVAAIIIQSELNKLAK